MLHQASWNELLAHTSSTYLILFEVLLLVEFLLGKKKLETVSKNDSVKDLDKSLQAHTQLKVYKHILNPTNDDLDSQFQLKGKSYFLNKKNKKAKATS